jgi:hypothetical protein
MRLSCCLPRIGLCIGPGQLLLLLGSLSCAGDRAPENRDPDRDTTTMSAPADTVRVELDVPAQVTAGDSVPITVRVQNISNRRLDLSLLGREIAFDILISTRAGQQVWRRLEGAALQSILQVKSLAPGEAFELHAVWRAATPGEYLVSASLPTDAAPLVTRQPTALRVLPRG